MSVLNQILDKISSPEFQTIIIHRHQNPDPDALGSQGGLQKLIQRAFPDKQVFSVGEEVASLTFMHNMDTISDETYQNALVIVTDTANTKRISDERFALGKYLIKIDHHPDKEPFGDLSWVDTSFSSASEMIYSLIEESQGVLTLDGDSARLLYTGILGDTGHFKYNNTTSRTFHVAGELLKEDFIPQDVHLKLYQEPLDVIRFKGYVLRNFTCTDKGVAYMHITKEMLNLFGILPTDAANLIYILQDIETAPIWAFFIEYDENTRVRIRSKGPEIESIARKYSGGGHPLASGATVYTPQEAKALIADLDALL